MLLVTESRKTGSDGCGQKLISPLLKLPTPAPSFFSFSIFRIPPFSGIPLGMTLIERKVAHLGRSQIHAHEPT